MPIFLNGRLVPENEALISVHDAGLQHGVGLFETMAAFHGRVFRLREHLARLADSAVALGLVRKLEIGPLSAAVQMTLDANALSEARLRLTLTAGSLSLLPNRAPTSGAPEITPTLLIVATPPTQYDPAYFTQGIRVLVAPACANPMDALAGHKTLAYWERLRRLRQAAAAGAQEVIWLNITNHLASGAVSNLFLVKDGVLLTPFARGEEVEGALPAPVLPGITRAAVIELAQRAGLPVQRRMLSIKDLLEADEAFLTNSSWQVLPITSVEKATLSNGQAGPVTAHLRTALLDLIEAETTSTPTEPEVPLP